MSRQADPDSLYHWLYTCDLCGQEKTQPLCHPEPPRGWSKPAPGIHHCAECRREHVGGAE